MRSEAKQTMLPTPFISAFTSSAFSSSALILPTPSHSKDTVFATVVACYGKYHDKGLDIIGVSFDQKKEARPHPPATEGGAGLSEITGNSGEGDEGS